MITLEKFKEVFKVLNEFSEDNDKLSKILLKDTYGFVDYGFPIEGIVLDLLNNIFEGDDPDLFSWWLYEKTEKVIYWNEKNIEYDLTNIEDLYYYARKMYNRVKVR